MVVVDSSVWVEFFRGRDLRLVEQVASLLDRDEVALAAPVRLEILLGASNKELPLLRRVLSALPLLLPSAELWDKLDLSVERARRAGQRFSALDLLIAGIADEHDATLWSLDQDFTRMARLGLVRLHVL